MLRVRNPPQARTLQLLEWTNLIILPTTQHMVHHQQLPTNLPTEQKTKAWNQLANPLSPLTELGFFQAHDSGDISPHDNIIPAKAMPLK